MTNIDWKDAIAFMQQYTENHPDKEYGLLIWQKLQLGYRTQDILMDISAMKSMQDNAASSSPEWTKAIKWLTYQRSVSSNLMIDMCWKQLETGDRTPELLALIRQAAAAPPIPAPAPVPIPEPPPVDNTPPSTDF